MKESRVYRSVCKFKRKTALCRACVVERRRLWKQERVLRAEKAVWSRARVGRRRKPLRHKRVQVAWGSCQVLLGVERVLFTEGKPYVTKRVFRWKEIC